MTTTNSRPFDLILPDDIKHPLIISAPHVGTAFPEEVQASFKPDVIDYPYDTDWLVHEIYRPLAEELSVPLIAAQYSRYVVDLNRDPKGQQLYNDGRQETSIVPLKSFADAALYQPGKEPDDTEIQRRIKSYHEPYYEQIAQLVDRLKKGHKDVVFYDGHSIKRQVPTIRPEPFPDLILGTNEGKAAHPSLAKAACAALKDGEYDVRQDEIFKGGYLTRHFGDPDNGVHALQLERCWDLYLQDDPRHIDENKVKRLRRALRNMFSDILTVLEKI